MERRRDLLLRFEEIDLSGLSAADRINARMFERQLRSSVQGFEFGGYQMPLNADSGFHMGFARMYRPMPFQTPDHYDDYIARMRAIPAYFEQQQGHMRAGIERGFTLPRITVEGYEDTISAQITDDLRDSAFWAPFEEVPASVGEMDRERIMTDAEASITEGRWRRPSRGSTTSSPAAPRRPRGPRRYAPRSPGPVPPSRRQTSPRVLPSILLASVCPPLFNGMAAVSPTLAERVSCRR